MRILLTGVSGFIGSQLLPQLHRAGHDLRVLARSPAQLRIPATWNVDVVQGDVVMNKGLARALGDIEVAYYLIHSMEGTTTADASPEREQRTANASPEREQRTANASPERERPTANASPERERPTANASPERERPTADAFPERERRAAENFTVAAQRAGVKRIVYLGGPRPATQPPSPHLASRLEVERILLEGIPASVALRAAIVIGARSRSFRFMVRMVERLPVLTLPAWRRYRIQPIDVRDVAEMLVAAAHEPRVAGLSLDIGGPQVLSYGEMLQRIAELMLVDRPALNLPVQLTPITARVASAVAQEDPELMLPLMESLDCDLLLGDDRAAQLLNVHLHSFDAAVEHALREWEAVEPLRAR